MWHIIGLTLQKSIYLLDTVLAYCWGGNHFTNTSLYVLHMQALSRKSVIRMTATVLVRNGTKCDGQFLREPYMTHIWPVELGLLKFSTEWYRMKMNSLNKQLCTDHDKSRLECDNYTKSVNFNDNHTNHVLDLNVFLFNLQLPWLMAWLDTQWRSIICSNDFIRACHIQSKFRW